MAILLDQITIGSTRIAVLDSDPNISSGYEAEIGSIALVPSTAKLFFKSAILDTDWSEVATAASINELAQDAVGNILTNSAEIEFTYNDAGDQISALLAVSGVSAGSYGSAANTVSISVDSKGRITSASSVPIAITASQVSDFNEAAQDAVGATLVDTASVDLTYNDGSNEITATVLPAGVDHNQLANLAAGDVHTQYVKNLGRAGGQIVDGGIAASENLNLSSTADATKGKIFLGANVAVDEANTRFGVGTASPSAPMEISTSSSIFQIHQGNVQTVGAITSTVFSYAVPLNKGVYIKAFIIGFDTSNRAAVYERSTGARNAASVVTQIGVTQSDFTEEATGITTANASMDVSSGAVRVRVSGVAGSTINWYCTVQVTTF